VVAASFTLAFLAGAFWLPSVADFHDVAPLSTIGLGWLAFFALAAAAWWGAAAPAPAGLPAFIIGTAVPSFLLGAFYGLSGWLLLGVGFLGESVAAALGVPDVFKGSGDYGGCGQAFGFSMCWPAVLAGGIYPALRAAASGSRAFRVVCALTGVLVSASVFVFWVYGVCPGQRR
jgi:hypothetical protein